MYNNIISTIALIVSGISLWHTIFSRKKDLKKALHNEIYTKIYLPFFEQILRVYSLTPDNPSSKTAAETFNDFFKNLDYARFFISSKDYKKIMSIYKETSELILKAVNITDGSQRLKNIIAIQNDVNSKIEEFKKIMEKHLQIG